MKPLIYCLFLVLLFSACHQQPSASNSNNIPGGISDSLAAHTLGTYSGQFGKGMLSLDINYINGRIVSGYDIHKGLRRNVNGEATLEGGQLRMTLQEPGDNPYDGVFHLLLDTASGKITGKWMANDSARIQSRNLALTRKTEGSEMVHGWGAGENQRDSVLFLREKDICSFEFYERPQDSTSQLITLTGNYIRKGDTIRIEWEKNTHIPARMTLVYNEGEATDSVKYTPPSLTGNGFTFYPLGD